MAWHSVSGEPLGDLAEVGREITIYWGRVCGFRQQDDADEEECRSFVQERHGPQWEWQDGRT